MNWKNLKQNKCPKCSEDMQKNYHRPNKYNSIVCEGCGFFMKSSQFEVIKQDMKDKKFSTRK